MALRIVAQKPLDYFKNLRGELNDDMNHENVKQ